VKVVSWNVNGNAAVEDQADAVLGVSPDLVALQEVRRGTVEMWKRKFAEDDFAAEDIFTTEHLVGDRTNFLLVASRHPMAPAGRRRSPSLDFEVPFPELVLSALVVVDGHELELINTHVPNGSSNGFRKVEHFEGLYRYLSRTWSPHGRPRVLCGDSTVLAQSTRMEPSSRGGSAPAASSLPTEVSAGMPRSGA
jgi:exonuclease III